MKYDPNKAEKFSPEYILYFYTSEFLDLLVSLEWVFARKTTNTFDFIVKEWDERMVDWKAGMDQLYDLCPEAFPKDYQKEAIKDDF